jgi:hypothetical protein
VRIRNLIWYDIGLLIGTALTAAAALARRIHHPDDAADGDQKATATAHSTSSDRGTAPPTS